MEIENLLNKSDVQRVRTDMCQFESESYRYKIEKDILKLQMVELFF